MSDQFPSANAPSSQIVIADVEITVDAEGRYNLNALHRAYEADKGVECPSKAPAQWMRTKQAQEYIKEISDMQICTSPVFASKGGVGIQGTFAHELVAVEYAGWISPAFRIKVNQTFLDYRAGKLVSTTPQLPDFTDPVAAARAWADEVEAKLKLEAQARALLQQIETDRPYTEIARAITGQSTMTRRDWCALMKDDHGLNIRERALTQWLMDHGYLYRDQLSGEARAYAQHARLFKLEVHVIQGFPRKVLMVTGDGVLHLTPIIVAAFSGMEVAA